MSQLSLVPPFNLDGQSRQSSSSGLLHWRFDFAAIFFTVLTLSAIAPASSKPWVHWAQLVRLPNVFTVVADVGAAFLLVAHGPDPIARFVTVIAAGIALYWAGMILNDVFDVEKDRAERSNRPLVAGHIAIGTARAVGWGLMVIGVALGGISGYLPSDDYAVTWFPAAIAISLAVMIVLYNGPLKKTPTAPTAMGACRVLSFLLGASPCFAFVVGEPLMPKYLFGIAVAFGVYVMGLTTMARREAVGGVSHHLPIGLVVTGMGCVLLALAPQLALNPRHPDVASWHASPTSLFPLMIGLVAFPVLVRAFRAVRDPSPAKIQMAIRVGILSIIPLAAVYAFLGAGPGWAMAVFALAVPSILLAARLRVT